MVDSADRYIAENRRDIRRTEANFIEAPESGSISLTFGRNVVEVEVTGEVYKRDLNDSLIVGHPNGSDHGIGTGAVGDQRGDWTLVASDEDSGELVRDGRGAIRDALDGQEGGVREVGVGTGTSGANSGDRTLVSLSSKTNGATDKPAPKAAGAMGVFRFHEHENEATEFGVYDVDGSLIARLTFSGVNPTPEEEVRVLVSLTVSGEGVGDSVFTDDGEIAIADALNLPKQVVGLNEIAFGTGFTEFSKSDTGLTSEIISKTVIRDLELEAIRARTKLYESEPASQPVDLSEMAVFDNSSTPRMLWATTFSPEEKVDGVPLTGTVGFRIE
jgi:hypothetical protein